MRQFLQETLELWYWSMFRPSQLQQRMNEWSLNSEIKYKDILFDPANNRFKNQYLLAAIFLNIPLFILVLTSHLNTAWLVLFSLLFTYGTSRFSMLAGLHWPLLLAIVYQGDPSIYTKVFGEASAIVSPFFSLGIGVLSSATILCVTSLFYVKISQYNCFYLARICFVLGSMSSVLSGSWFFTKNILLTLLLTFITTIMTSTFIFLLEDWSHAYVESVVSVVTITCLLISILAGTVVVIVIGVIFDVTFGIAVGVAFVITVIFAFVVATEFVEEIAVKIWDNFESKVVDESTISVGIISAFGVVYLIESFVAVVFGVIVAGVVTAMATLPVKLFLISCGLIAFSLAPLKSPPLGVILAITLASFRSQISGLSEILAIPVVLLFYYRVFPDYINCLPLSLWPVIPIDSLFQPPPLQILHWLPPNTTELFWIPLPNHDRILTAAFRSDATEAIKTYQKMQDLYLPGFQRTIQKALPQIAADQMATVNSTSELLFTTTSEHPFLPLLTPNFYQQDKSSINQRTTKIDSELLILVPRLHRFAQDIDAALNASNTALRERGLERILNDLKLTLAQLSGLGLSPKAIKRWQPVLERWQQIVLLELEQQKIVSQGELLNPFQYGNPLRNDRSDLFKGRQAFADQIVRQILDRDRPTLVLHGPRRCGKSSFLLNLPRLLPSHILPVFLDMQSAAVTTDAAGFCQGLTRAIRRDSRSQGLDLPPIPQRQAFLDSPYIALEDWLEQALPILEDRTLLLNLDEFEKIGSAIKAGKFNEDFLNELRHLIQHYDQLGFLFSGVQTLDELAPHWSDYFISVVPIEMLYLEPNEARELLEDPDPDFTLQYDTGIVDEILDLTRCQPYLLQLLGAAMVTQANLHHTELITPPLLQAAIQAAFTNGEPYFTNVWQEFTGTSPEEVAAGQSFLLALAQEEQSTPNDHQLAQAALRRMQRYHILEQHNGHSQFEIPLVKMWVRERAVRD